MSGAWNDVTIGQAPVTKGSTYWIALLGTGGHIDYLDTSAGSGASYVESNPSLNSLPTSYSTAHEWNVSPASAYVIGAPGSGGDPQAPSPPSSTTAPQITGTTTQGDTLSTSNGSWGGSPSSYAYQWQDCTTTQCSDISGATSSSYTLQSSDVGSAIDVVVTATNGGGSTAATSAHTATVTAPPPPAPSNTALPQITGTAQQGQTLSTSNGSWSGSPSSYTYQWQDCDSSGASCTNISNASASTYTLTGNDVNHTIRAVVTATNSGGSTSAASPQTATVTAPAPSPSPAPSYAPAFVQGNACLSTRTTPPSLSGVSSLSCTFTSNVTKGNLVVVAFGYRNSAEAATVSDTLGTTFHTVETQTSTQTAGCASACSYPFTGSIAYGNTPAGGADTITVSLPGGAGIEEIYEHEYNALNSTFDVGSSQNNSGLTISSGSAATTRPNEMIFGYMISNSSAGAAGSGFTERESNDGDLTEDQNVSATGSYAATATNPNGDGNSGLMATFYGAGPNPNGGAGGGGGPSVPSNTALPQITGTTTQGDTLSTSNGSWSGSPTSYTYQWQDCNSSGFSCSNISGATSSSYTLTTGDVGHTIRSIVTATNDGGSTSATSNPTSSVAATSGGGSAPATSGGGSAPVNTVGPYFTASTGTTTECSAGCAIVGQVLTVSTGSWSPAPTSYTYQWNRCTTTSGQPPTTSSCSAIPGATSSSYTVTSADVGHSLTPVVTAYNGSSASTPTTVSGRATLVKLSLPENQVLRSPRRRLRAARPSAPSLRPPSRPRSSAPTPSRPAALRTR